MLAAVAFLSAMSTLSRSTVYVVDKRGSDRIHGTVAGAPNTNASSSALFDEQQVAELLRVKCCTVRNERVRGNLAFIRVGRRIFYTQKQISDYLERQSVQACVDSYQRQNPGQARSEIIGSARNPAATRTRTPGAGPGMTNVQDKHAVSALAQQIFKRRASS